jgi:hypothetical protein
MLLGSNQAVPAFISVDVVGSIDWEVQQIGSWTATSKV